MSVLGNSQLLMTPEGYQISRSVRLRSSASAYLNRTPASAGNLSTWTFSAWVKRGTLSSGYQVLCMGGNTTNDNTLAIYFSPTDKLQIQGYSTTYYASSQVFRDPSAWYHIVVALDSTQVTQANRCKVYVNGVLISASTNAFPLNGSWNLNNNLLQTIGYQSAVWGFNYLDGYLTEINFIDGQALTPSSFGETNPVTGVWQPKKYAGTYGTNGFYLNFSDNSAATAAAIGKDYSGNGNNWTPNNISVTAGVTYDSMIDTPTPYADGGNGRGNYCTLNPLDKNWWLAAVSTQATISNANLTASVGAADTKVASTISVLGGKYYAEVTVTSQEITNIIVSGYAPTTFEIAYINSGNKSVNRTQTAYGATYGTGDVIGVAVDAPNNQVTFYKNGASQGTITNTFIGDAIFIGAYLYNSNLSFNFGQRPFAYTPPTGFKALNTQNLPEPTIKQGDDYFNAVLYTGTGADLAVTGVGFQPDFIWTKGRSAIDNHVLVDSIRGIGQILLSNATAAESTYAAFDSFDSDGFTKNSLESVSGRTYVAWNWKAGGTPAVTNTAGSITSTVSANTTSGFSVVTYTGNATNGATLGHGLGVAPKLMIVKPRVIVDNWNVYHESLGATKVLYMNLTNAVSTNATLWNNTAPTSSVFTVGTNSGINTNGSTYVAYLFAEIPGFSKFGSYTGNGSADGPMVFTGFRPRWLMLKRTDSTSDWYIYDTSRSAYNAGTQTLAADLSLAESSFASTNYFDILSNGFKLRQDNASGYANASGGTYIYAAFAENAFKVALAR